jgi:hypothetical protein
MAPLQTEAQSTIRSEMESTPTNKQSRFFLLKIRVEVEQAAEKTRSIIQIRGSRIGISARCRRLVKWMISIRVCTMGPALTEEVQDFNRLTETKSGQSGLKTLWIYLEMLQKFRCSLADDSISLMKTISSLKANWWSTSLASDISTCQDGAK